MATFISTFTYIQNRTIRGGEAPVPAGKGALRCTNLTTGASAGTVQRASADFTAPGDGFIMARADAAVVMAIGETASATVGHYIPASETYWVSIKSGETVSVIDA